MAIVFKIERSEPLPIHASVVHRLEETGWIHNSNCGVAKSNVEVQSHHQVRAGGVPCLRFLDKSPCT
eukprot:3266161-Amphidinium_carterae.1